MPRAPSGRTKNKGSAGQSRAAAPSVLTATNPFASPGPGNCSCAAPVLPRAPTGAAPTWGTARPAGSATAVLAWAPVRGKAPGCPWAGARAQARPGSGCPGWAWQSLSAPGGLGAPPWPIRPRAWAAVPLTFLLPLTAASAGLELAGPSTAGQSGAGPSHSSPAPETTSSPSTSSQLPLGLSHGSPAPATRSLSTGSQASSGPSQGSPGLESGRRSSPPGPDRTPDRSRLKRRAPTPCCRTRRRRESGGAPTPSADGSTSSQAALGPSHSSVAPETSSPSTASQLPSGSSSGRPALESGARSSPLGPVRTRDRSRLQRRAQTPYSRPGRRHGASRAPPPSAAPHPPPPAE